MLVSILGILVPPDWYKESNIDFRNVFTWVGMLVFGTCSISWIIYAIYNGLTAAINLFMLIMETI